QWMLPENYAWNSPAWSISAEMFAYTFIFPIVVEIARHRDRFGAGLYLIGVGTALLALLICTTGSLNAIPTIGPLIRVTGSFMVGAGVYCILSGHSPTARWDWLLIAGAAV